MIRAVLDVNVLISAFIGGAEGPPRRLIYAWREGRFSLVVSPALLDELTIVLGRPKFDRWAGKRRFRRTVRAGQSCTAATGAGVAAQARFPFEVLLTVWG